MKFDVLLRAVLLLCTTIKTLRKNFIEQTKDRCCDFKIPIR